jgi:GNAT superfamily N-acetyltransferase
MDAVVRDAATDDAHAIATIHVATWQHAYRDIMPKSLLDGLSVFQRTEDWKKRLEPSDRKTFVLETDGTIRGWASIGPSRDPDVNGEFGELYGIYLAPSHIGKRYGHPLYDRCEEELANRGYRFVSLWVIEGNSGARRFYEKSGFRPDGQKKTIVLGGADLPELRYAKKITLKNQSRDPTP